MMLTTGDVAPVVRLNNEWQDKYRDRAKEPRRGSLPSYELPAFTICIVGRSGVGKGTLINHLLGQHRARVVHSVSSVPDEERAFEIYGFRVREIPGYDGKHVIASQSRQSWRQRGKPSRGSTGRMELENFVKAYCLFEQETNAMIFVVNNRITADDQKLMSLAIRSRKFFCVVRTHADSIARIKDCSLQKERIQELEQEIRQELSLITDLNVHIFIVTIPWPESKITGPDLEGSDIQEVLNNRQLLQFPQLQSYLTEPKGLCDELQIHGFVKEEVSKALVPFQTIRKRDQALDFSEHLVAGTLLPIAGPVLLTFMTTLFQTLKACRDVGLIEDADDAIQKVNAETQKAFLVTHIASKEGLVTAVHDSLVHIFGSVIFDIAIAEVVSTVAEVALSGSLPLVGPFISAIHLPTRYGKIADRLAVKASMLHELWIMQNITGLLVKTEQL